MLDVSCPSCGEIYHVAQEHTGRSLRCRRCDRVFEIVSHARSGDTAQPARAAATATPTETTPMNSATAHTPSAAQAQSPTAGAAAGYSKPIAVTDRDFAHSVLGSPQLVVVDFWAAWCGPCRAIAPAVEQLAAEYAGRVTFAKLNADENPRTMSQYGVMGLPTLVFYKGGQEVGRLVGLQPKASIKRLVDQLA